MKIAVIGAGIGGMAAAYDLNRAGHKVIVYEAADHVGGLASGFKDPSWDWTIEKYYHHWFSSDHDILGLIRELGWQDNVIFPRPYTVMFYDDKFYPLDSPIAALKFPGFNLFDIARFGLVTVFLRYIASWKPLEKFTADAWMSRFYGKHLYSILFEPLLLGKFGDHYQEVNMAWFWARLKTRTTRLGTYKGGFQNFANQFADYLRQNGVVIHLSTQVQGIEPHAGKGLEIQTDSGTHVVDQCLVTVSPALMAKMTPTLPAEYLDGLLSLKSMGAVVLIMALKQKFSEKGYYWFNMPKSAGFPFLALVEHTNFVPSKNFGGDHIIYCGDYLEVDHEYFQLTQDELLERFLPGLKRINPDFNINWVRKTWLFRTNYAQPIPLVNHSHNIPAIQTPIKGLYFASMSQVYPWDRGTNFAVQIARQAVKSMLADA